MSIYFLRRLQRFPISLEQAWDFFSSPSNLKEITPESLNFTILSMHKEKKMYPGMIVRYKVSPLFRVPVTWLTEITHVQELSYFIDEQKIGPYAFWHHEHHFRPIAQGVEMEDLVYYKLPFGLLGTLLHSLIAQKKLADIFDYRFKKLEEHFGPYEG